MQKNPDKQKEEISEIPKHKGRKNKGETSCQVKKQGYYNCNICGSENLVREGVTSCMYCLKEESFIREGGDDWLSWYLTNKREKKEFCQCYKNKSIRKLGEWFYSPESKNIEVCVDCGAHKGPLCPNCKNPAWYKFENGQNKVACPNCRYRNYGDNY